MMQNKYPSTQLTNSNFQQECENKQAIVQEIAEAGGKQKLEILQRNTDETVSSKAKALLEMHFDNKRDNSDESDIESQGDALVN